LGTTVLRSSDLRAGLSNSLIAGWVLFATFGAATFFRGFWRKIWTSCGDYGADITLTESVSFSVSSIVSTLNSWRPDWV
jgi:hypothetical protein